MSVVRFPVERVMPIGIAERAIGKIKTFRAPYDGDEKWLSEWLVGKYVLLGWDVVSDGLIKSFKGSKVRHRIVAVHNKRLRHGTRPCVSVSCRSGSFYIANWKSEFNIKSPVTLLSTSQAKYFKVCKKCEKTQAGKDNCNVNVRDSKG